MSIMLQAMTEWEIASKNKIKFIQTDNIGDGILHIVNIRGNNDNYLSGPSIGYSKDHPVYILISGEMTIKMMRHELGHVLGLIHEHQRPDRDIYITIDRSKSFDIIEFSQIINFNEPDGYDFKDYYYDYSSIMHYTESESHHIISAPFPIGGNTISITDAEKVSDMYSVFIR